jgi:hypothetical protein
VCRERAAAQQQQQQQQEQKIHDGGRTMQYRAHTAALSTVVHASLF